MASGRILKTQISLSEQVNDLSLHAALLFTWMIPHADDFGRMVGNARKVKALVVPMRDDFTSIMVDECLKEMSYAHLIERYEVNGEFFLQFPEWEIHQSGLHKRTKSKLPGPSNIEIPGNSGKFLVEQEQEQEQEQEREQEHTNSDIVGPITAGQVCVELTRLGIMQVNPMHPELLAAIAAGATMQDFSFAATESVQKRKGFAYLVAIVKNKIQENRGNNANKNNNEARTGAGRKLSNAEQADRDIEMLEELDRARQERVIN